MQPPRGVPRKRCSENMQQIFRTPFLKNTSRRLLLKASILIQKIGKYELNNPPRMRAEVGKYNLCHST